MPAFQKLTSRLVALPVNDVDTDQIIPARFLKVTDKSGLASNLFCDWRYRADGSPNPDFVLNRPEAKGAEILLAGDNFGCGSSREHAPWALCDFGFRAVIALSFADIFRNNALKNGLLPVAVDASAHAALLTGIQADADFQVSIDLATQTLSWPGSASIRFDVDAFAKRCLLEGVDELGYLQSFIDKIKAFETARQ